MSHTSPATFLVWAIVSLLLGCFLVYHLWSFDRFKCLRWNNGPYSGAFKRIMTYSYLLSIPLIIIFAVGFCVIKYSAGFMDIPGHGIIPTPYQVWTTTQRNAIFPLNLAFSVAWSLEMVTHLEELCFWLFLVNAGSAQQDWFRSMYFRTWVVGALIAVIYMPLVTIFTRSDPLKCEAYTFLAGSLGSTALTLWFTPVLWTFPSFLESLRREGVDISTMARLTKFHELNMIRVVFRFMFTIPLIILGVDGVRPHEHINESMLWTDILTMVAAIGCCVSSAITLTIFFPRSIESEITNKQAARERKSNRSGKSMIDSRMHTLSDHSQTISISHNHIPSSGTYLLTSSPIKRTLSMHTDDELDYQSQYPIPPLYHSKVWTDDEEEEDIAALDMATPLPKLPPLRPNRRVASSDVELGGIGSVHLSESNLSRHNARLSNLNPMVHNFTSPINFVYTSRNTSFTEMPMPGSNESRFTFTQR